jgi:alpha-1,3-mannosyltransferase
MSVLLGLPAVGFVLLQAVGSERAITQAMLIAQTQVSYHLLVKLNNLK